DGERGILVGPRGDFSWLCFPYWDSEPVFSSLIGGAGTRAVTPTSPFVWGGYYEQGGLIWRNRWVTQENAIVECREALALPTAARRAVVLRRVVACGGEAHVSVCLAVRAGFGEEPLVDLRRDDAGVWLGRSGEVRFRWAGGDRAEVLHDERGDSYLRLELDLAEGEHHDLTLELVHDDQELELPDADAAWAGTEAAWRERVPRLELGVAQRDARHAVAVLTGLTSSTGGTVAAATGSLPERAGRGRNYDYRYVWI